MLYKILNWMGLTSYSISTYTLRFRIRYMFKLYYFVNPQVPSLVFSHDDLAPCLDFIRFHKYIFTRCAIVSPNNRKITFDSNNNMIFN